jgi:hypothetical protein
MTIETQIALLTAATTALTDAVATQQTGVDAAVAQFAATISSVTNDLNSVDNTTDLDKPISTAVASALADKQETLVSGDNFSTVNGQSLLGGDALVIERSATSLVSLAYENRGTLNSDPSAGNPQNVVDDSVVVEGLGIFMWVTTLNEPDDDETCFSTPSGQWLLVMPAIDLLSSMELFEDSVVDEYIEDQIVAWNEHH